MNQSIESSILFDDNKMIAGHSGANNVRFDDCDNNPVIANDILFNDAAMVEAKLGLAYFQNTATNANCDCGR